MPKQTCPHSFLQAVCLVYIPWPLMLPPFLAPLSLHEMLGDGFGHTHSICSVSAVNLSLRGACQQAVSGYWLSFSCHGQLLSSTTVMLIYYLRHLKASILLCFHVVSWFDNKRCHLFVDKSQGTFFHQVHSVSSGSEMAPPERNVPVHGTICGKAMSYA